MRALSSILRKQLEAAVLAARRAAESGSRAALDGLGVFADRRPEHLNEEQAAMRNGLRAKWRQLGGERELLVTECAYEQWHRLLFARFLAENDLLLHPDYRAPVTLDECEELANELGEPDGWSVASRFAAEILPGIFRLADPCVRLRLTPEGRYALELIVAALPSEVFATADALGWVYQFWQKDKKDEINASERKIGGADLGPVTQLFTENYMVRFLLENSLGAWWASRHPESPLVKDFDYLRFDDEGRPAAGSFDGWPEHVAEVTVMDPCCGSGHFLVEAFSMLWQMRAEEEGVDSVDAQDAVLRDNLFGLELDPRCVQIAMFAVALQAWKPVGKWRPLPVPNIACSGIPVKCPVDEWKKLARGNERLENALVRLYILFRDADTLGSLIDPRRATEIRDPSGLQRSLEDVDWNEMAPFLDRVAISGNDDPAAAVLGSEANSIGRAARLLAKRYVLTATNVPYLSRQSQSTYLRDFCERRYAIARADLATVMVTRCRELAQSAAVVAPQNWEFLGTYAFFRKDLLESLSLRLSIRLGPGAFAGITGEVVKPVLMILSCGSDDAMLGDLSANPSGTAKQGALLSTILVGTSQLALLANPGAVISQELTRAGHLLARSASSHQGLITGDNNRFLRGFWEVPLTAGGWERVVTSPAETGDFAGRESVLDWNWERSDSHYGGPLARIQGQGGWGRRGVVISRVGRLAATLSLGEIVVDKGASITLADEANLPALWALVQSDEYDRAVRQVDAALAAASGSLVKVAFDLEYWQKAADEAGPLPEPFSDDPTQWLFEGQPQVTTSPLQVAVGRLLGYRWPEQPESDDLDRFSDVDGIACLPSVAGEPSAVDRLQAVLATAFGEAWSPTKAKELFDRSRSKKKNLPDWLRDEFFKQHCALFRNRPFVWHIWDGQRDGFSALVNYHRLDRKLLEKLTYSYLGQDWVERQRAEARDEAAGAEARLAAAFNLQRKLEAILNGEKPFDISVRWKQLHEQPVGWEPDLNDGVRLNIRPFVKAGVLRTPLNIHWKKDRGKNPDGSERHNDVHLSLAEKVAARKRVVES